MIPSGTLEMLRKQVWSETSYKFSLLTWQLHFSAVFVKTLDSGKARILEG